MILGLAPIDEVDVWLSHYGHGWGDIEIPPDQITEVVMDCMWEADLTIATLHGHMHHGLSHSVDLIRTDGSIERIYDLPDWNPQWRNDPVQEDFDGAGLEVHPGDRFVTTCRWDNNTGGTIYFPEEMCGTSGILYGSMAPINCDPSRDDGPPR